MKRTIRTDRAPGALGPASQAVVANGMIFVAGQVAIDPPAGSVMQIGRLRSGAAVEIEVVALR